MKILKDNKIKFILGAIFLTLLMIAASFAYFQIVANNNATTSTISGAGDLVGMATLVTNTEELNIKLTAEDMKKEKANTIYSATKDGKPVVTEGIGLTNQTLATASMTESDIVFDCTYTYDISATVTKEITDGSDEDIAIFISNDSGEMTFYSLKQLLEGVVYTGKLQKLNYGEDQMINIEVLVYNSELPQNDLSGNEFTITIDPKEGEEGFSCQAALDLRQYSLSYAEDITDKDIIDLGNGIPLVKVSNDTPSSDELSGAVLELINFEGVTSTGVLDVRQCWKFANDALYCGAYYVVYESSDYIPGEPGFYIAYEEASKITVTLKEPSPKVVAELNNNTITASVSKTKLEPKQYCINTSQSYTDDCEWKDLESYDITSQINGLGTYYVHVKDEIGFIGHSEQMMKYNPTGIAKSIIDKNEMWKSGLENDGYRYIGMSNQYCEYADGNFYNYISESNSTCPKAFKYIKTDLETNVSEVGYSNTCPTNNSYYKYECEEISGTIKTGKQPNNYICFGTSNKHECTSAVADENGLTGIDKYMYRIIGAFPDEQGSMHLKLISYKQLGNFKWSDSGATNIYNWGENTLNTRLNGSDFLTNVKYSYLQDTTWLNKIENWTWKATNTTKDADYTFSYPYQKDVKEIYFHEMDSNSNLWKGYGIWDTVQSKIGLMYVSDIIFSVENYKTNKSLAGWLHQNSNDTTKNENEWTITADIFPNVEGYGSAYTITNTASYSLGSVTSTAAVRPTFYLTSDVELGSGTGTYTDPYIIG